ncbi:MAG: hypothetical protein LBQ47_02795 [Endomicrobium sp.]|jgi:hypothetical protein|nr:hypothetical protein [Endomicrobium sp.]
MLQSEIDELNRVFDEVEKENNAKFDKLYDSAETEAVLKRADIDEETRREIEEAQARREKIKDKVNEFLKNQLLTLKSKARNEITEEVNKIMDATAAALDDEYDFPKDMTIRQQMQGLMFDKDAKKAIDRYFVSIR